MSLTRFIAIVLVIPTCAYSQSADHPDASAPIFGRIEGKWDIVSNAKLCEQGTDIHTIRFNANRTVATFNRPNPPTDDDGKLVRSYSYTVISATASSITMHLIGEKRKLRTGDDYIWVIQEREPNVYSWRLYGFELRNPEPTTFRKCE